ncbi:MAG: TrbC/VirB2 family protein [Alphaproteobacteria bacterium]|nr:TrbC/VirB2 family protein [Alphaproteobacteria bacterium]
MLWIKIKNFLWNNRYTICLALSLFLYTADAYATFQEFIDAGDQIFAGLKKIIWPAATIGISSVCIAGMFGSFNWKWFIAILLGVFIIATAESFSSLVGSGPSQQTAMSGNE